MPDQHCGIGAQRIRQADQIADEMEDGVSIDRLRAVALSVAAHIGRHDPESRFRKGWNLMAPGIPRLREAVAEDDRRPGSLLGDIDADAVRFDDACNRLRHIGLFCRHPPD